MAKQAAHSYRVTHAKAVIESIIKHMTPNPEDKDAYIFSSTSVCSQYPKGAYFIGTLAAFELLGVIQPIDPLIASRPKSAATIYSIKKKELARLKKLAGVE